MSDKITLRCSACGSDQFSYPPEADLKNEDVVTCAGCGAQGEYGVIRKQGIKAAKDAVESEIRKALKGIKGFK